MTIRSKLLLFYGIMLVAVLAVGAASIWAMLRWRMAAENLSVTRGQGLRAERLRAGVYLQVNYVLDFLGGEVNSEQEFWRTEGQVGKHLDELKLHALTQEEKDHIEGLEETKFELTWTSKGIFQSIRDSTTDFDLSIARSRLREIADEAADDVTVLNQYYRAQVDQSVIAASHAGTYAAIVIGGAVIVALFQLLALIFLSQRWLVRPIESVSKATKVISAGNFDILLPLSTKDEWGRLARSINDMARSLKSLQQQVRTQERLAALGEVAAYTAHNIQNPLAGIRAAAQVTLKDLSPEEKEAAQSLQDIIQVVDRLDLWIRRLLNFAKPLTLQKAPTDINKAIAQTLSIVVNKFSRKGIQVKTIFADGLPLIQIDPVLFQQAIAAIVTNSFEAGGNEIAIQTESVCEREGGEWFSVSISDNGRGVSPEIKPKLFHAFVTDKEGGTGLGLAQAKKIVDLHGGELSLDSRPGEGASVLIRLPLDANLRVEGSSNAS